jgi:vancomycin permeability regulator SanA
VLGAAVQPDKRPSPILRDRVEVAVELVKAGRVQHLLLSGASRPHYNEVAAMRRTALELGVSADLLSDDENGAHTYQSCLNAKKVFGLDEVVVVTQRFHLPRAIYLCQSVGLKTQGVPADRTPDQESVRHALREAGAWVLAIVNTHL